MYSQTGKISIQESSRLSKSSKIEYLYRLKKFYEFAPIKSDEELIDCPSEELQKILLDYTRHILGRVERGELSPNTVTKMFRGNKVLLDANYRKNDIKWKPIEALFPRMAKRSGYKAWTTEQIRLMLENAKSLRNKTIIHFQASTGGRIGRKKGDRGVGIFLFKIPFRTMAN